MHINKNKYELENYHVLLYEKLKIINIFIIFFVSKIVHLRRY